MVEGQFVHLDDVGLSSLVLTVAIITFPGADVGVSAVIAATCIDVFLDEFVAGQAIGTLFFAVEFFVAFFAGMFVFGMTFNNFAGHDQGLNGCCPAQLSMHEREGRH